MSTPLPPPKNGLRIPLQGSPCGKLRWYSRAAAEVQRAGLEASNDARSYRRADGARLAVYYCGRCHAWHVGHRRGAS